MLIIFLLYYIITEFADAQMNIKDIKSNLVTSRIPYFDYQTYVCHQLFPNEDKLSNPLTNGSEVTFSELYTKS